MDAASIRKDLIKKRTQLISSQVTEWSSAICGNLKKFLSERLESEPSLNVSLYRPVRGEADILSLFGDTNLGGIRWCFPRVLSLERAHMDMVPKSNLEGAGWEQGPYGILQPLPQVPALSLAELDLLLIPGSAFSAKGARLGMGAGFYDRLLAGAPQASKIGVGYDLQICEELPQESWDIPMDHVVTQSRIYDCHH